MKRTPMTTSRILIAILGAATPALAQSQPWAAPNGSVNSTVSSCAAPTPLVAASLDDFQFAENRNISWIRWWGNVSANAQRNKHYYIAIWSNSTLAGTCPMPCNPSVVLQSWCVTAGTALAGMDCNGRNVYRFSAALAPAFAASAGTKYWLQICEEDADSVQLGVTDFRWSGYRPTRLCPAQQISAGGVRTCSISDDCVPPNGTDLAYVLKTACMAGGIGLPAGVAATPSSYLLEFRTSGANPNSPPKYITEVRPDEGGSFFIDDLPAEDGNYDVTLRGMGIRPAMATTMISNGIAMMVMFNVVAVGDLNNDGMLSGLDISHLVAGLLIP